MSVYLSTIYFDIRQGDLKTDYYYLDCLRLGGDEDLTAAKFETLYYHCNIN